MKANSLKDQEHLSSIKFAVKLNKEEYYHGEEVLGFIKIMLREEKPIYNIKLRFKQKEFWEQCCQVDDWLPWVVFVNREIPQYEIHSVEPSKCPDLYRIGQEMIQKAQANFDEYLEKYGLTNTWIEEQDPDTIQFTDVNFPQMMGML